MPSVRRSRTSSKKRRVRKTARRSKVPRNLGRLGKLSDVHHFKETVNAGVISWTPGTTTPANAGGSFVMRLTDLPMYQQMAPNFELRG